MTEFEDLLRQDMASATCTLQAPPTLLAQARLRGRAQRRRRRALLLAAPALAALAVTTTMAYGVSGRDAGPETLIPAQTTSGSTPDVSTWPGVVAESGPDDVALRAADWVGVANLYQQAGHGLPKSEQRWYGRNGLTYGNVGGKLSQLRNGDAPLGERDPGILVGAEPPHALAWEFGGDRYSFDLTPDGYGDGTVLTFVHVFTKRDHGADYGSGWHFYLDRLDAHLAGRPVPDAEPAELVALNDRYAEQFGLDPEVGRRALAGHSADQEHPH